MLTRIPRINYRVFRNQSWPSGLPAFNKYNLIYGWNGCGKTTLSGLLRRLEKKEALLTEEGAVTVEIDGTPVSASDFGTLQALPPVKVFNRDYVEASVFAGTGALSQIFYFGEGSVEKQKEILRLQEELKTATAENLRLKTVSDNAANTLEQFKTDQAKTIKKLLSSSGQNDYNNYDKRGFSATSERLKKGDYASKRLDEAKRSEATRKKELQLQDDLTALDTTLPDFASIRDRASELLKRTVVSRVLGDLAKEPRIDSWVQTGLGLHTGKHSTTTCRFCNQTLPADRLADIEAHFNQAYKQLLDDLATAQRECQTGITTVEETKAPFKEGFYSHLRDGVPAQGEILKTYRTEAKAYLNGIIDQLKDKEGKPFESISLNALLTAPEPDSKAAEAAIAAINDLIAKHNSTSMNLAKEVSVARKTLEEDQVAEALPELIRNQDARTAAANGFAQSNQAIEGLKKEIQGLEKQIDDSRRPAEELTQELASYLGQNDLKFETRDHGYTVTRGGVIASNLSEGEKTAIAFLHFLKSLNDRSFKKDHGIVVIDDPISSLDANALFCAFGFMKDKTNNVAQLFVLTHNFTFFRQVKNWFIFLNRGKKNNPVANFYMLRTSSPGGTRTSQLMGLDPLLKDFESEYHYLFFRVAEEAANTQPRDLSNYYAMPNIARRLLESFLSFRFPQIEGLNKQIDAIDQFDAAKRARIIRFLHTHSHDGKVAEPEHDLSILSETPDILKDLLALFEVVDKPHFDGMQYVLKTRTGDR